MSCLCTNQTVNRYGLRELQEVSRNSLVAGLHYQAEKDTIKAGSPDCADSTQLEQLLPLIDSRPVAVIDVVNG